MSQLGGISSLTLFELSPKSILLFFPQIMKLLAFPRSPHLLLLAGLLIAPLTASTRAAEPETPKTQIDIFAEEGPKITSAVGAPLGVPLSDYKAAITYLRDNLLDEAAAKPASSPQTYQAAAKLCAAWLNSIDEREKRMASLGMKGGATADTASSKKTVLHDWRDELNYFRELDDERRKKERDQQDATFFDDAMKKQWSDRCVEVHKYLDTLYSQFRQLRRESLMHAK
jgi:hypothetical protein